ncbi:fluoride efflux transporter CrcB [Mangrovimicrobium sediminis]|uniref:Fluoride-specific ion channel FluC n=1 Tax=Mangrovimicrobium sediminis TaxID=2562682 RepID=A0A4Z0M7A7_9GAMM|nr:fluoride efflux transporter CrcB [Haliea sp. SAOS-164]TGD75286.1 fluoride efflux transporter CrcB [Haliea sp. SAOS-164]
MKYLLFIALGGACGAVSRYLLSNWAHELFQARWPAGTLFVNALGSFCIGAIFVLIERQVLHPDWRSVLMVGFLGAFTTFSTFSLDVIALLEQGQLAPALGYTLASVVLCVLMTGLSIHLTRALV